ncbi:MAG: hypothetical protein PHI34_07070, partial [Acidobacteriota bacterium]|nr:hypothetical protein [Acidobacteriota bacterium]
DRSDEDYDIVSIPLDGSAPSALMATSRREYSPSWSAAGDRMAFVTDRLGPSEVWIRSRDGAWEKRILSPADLPGEPEALILAVALSADGKKTAFLAQSPKSGSKLWVAPVDGGRPVPAFPDVEREIGIPGWSPDGTWLASFIVREGNRELAVIRPGDADSLRILCRDRTHLAACPCWSPDGRWIASGNHDLIHLFAADGTAERTLRAGVNIQSDEGGLCWSADGAAVLVATTDAAGSRLDRVDVASGRQKRIAGLPPSFALRGPAGFLQSACLDPVTGAFTTSARALKSDLWILDGFPAL